MKLKLKNKAEPYSLILGFRGLERPDFMGSLCFPAATLTSLDSEQVSDLHSKYTLLYAYANQSLAETNVSILKLQNKRAERENQVFRENPGMNGLDKWRRDAKMREDEQVEVFNASLSYHHIVRVQLEMLLLNYEKFIAAIGRELSRKNYERKPEGF